MSMGTGVSVPTDSCANAQQMSNSNDYTTTCYVTIQGMTCASCVDSIQRNLAKVDGIHSVLVSLLGQRAEIKYNPEKILPSQIVTLVNNLGFEGELLEAAARGMEMIDINVRFTGVFTLIIITFPIFKVEGMTCTSCVNQIESYMRKIEGIKSIDVVLLTNRARVEYDPSIIGPRDILQHLNVHNFDRLV